MKLKKIIIFISFIYLLTGCTAEVNLRITNGSVDEKIVIVDTDATEENVVRYRKYYPLYYNDVIPDNAPDERIDGISYYNRSISELDSGYKITYENFYKMSNYNKSNTLKSNFMSAVIENDFNDGTINLYTDSNGILAFNRYPELTDLKVKITTKLEVIDSNADSINGNVYVWNISKDNSKRNIYIKLKNANYNEIHGIEDNNNKKQEEEKKEDNSLIIILVCVASFIGLLILLIFSKNKIGR